MSLGIWGLSTCFSCSQQALHTKDQKGTFVEFVLISFQTLFSFLHPAPECCCAYSILSFHLSHIQRHPNENSFLSVNWLTASSPSAPSELWGRVSCQFQITACCCWREVPIVFICSDSWLEAAGGIDLSLCLVCLWSGICPATPPLAELTRAHLHFLSSPFSSFPSLSFVTSYLAFSHTSS